MRHSYPLILDLSDRLAVIIGGGDVAARKARGLIEGGVGSIRCVAPAFPGQIPFQVEQVAEDYHSRHLEGAGLVFAATDSPDVNDAVVRDARARGVLVCRADADDEEPGDFITPARFAEGPVVVTVSTGSAALAVLVRDGLAQRFDPRWARMAEAMQTLRPRIRGCKSLDQARRAAAFRALATPEAIETLQASGLEGLQRWLGTRYPELAHV